MEFVTITMLQFGSQLIFFVHHPLGKVCYSQFSDTSCYQDGCYLTYLTAVSHATAKQHDQIRPNSISEQNNIFIFS